jgi:signal transduction histidine kinase
MRVELSKALSITAHEMRGPLGVLQGYLRMLKDGVVDGPTMGRMLQAMQDATGRLTHLARDASAIAAWQEGRQADDCERVPVDALLDRVAANVAGKPRTRWTVDPSVAQARVRSQPAGALAIALGAVLQAAHREAPSAPFRLHADGTGDGLVITMEPETGHFETAPEPLPFDFAAGGSGLALVLASHVLDAHGTQVTRRSGASVTVRIPREEGQP